MNRSRLSEWLTISTNVAVLAGIVILIIEIQQNSAALRSSVLQAVSSESSPLNLALATDSAMRDTWIRGLASPDALTESQRLQLNATLHVWFSNAQNWYYQMRNDVLDEEIADGHWTTMATMHHSSPGFQRYWETRKYLYTPSFRRFVETEVFTREPLAYSPDPNNLGSDSGSAIAAITAQLNELYDFSLAEGSVDALTQGQLRFFADQPTVRPPNESAIVGRVAVTEFYRNIFDSGIKVLNNSFADLDIAVQGNMAVRQYVGRGVFQIDDGAEPRTAVNRYLDVLVIENGEWKTLLHSWVPASLN